MNTRTYNELHCTESESVCPACGLNATDDDRQGTVYCGNADCEFFGKDLEDIPDSPNPQLLMQYEPRDRTE